MARERRVDVNESFHLSAIRASDQGTLVAHLNDGQIYRNTLRIPSPYSFEDAGKFLRIAAEATERYGFPIHFAIRNRERHLIGGCGFEGLVTGHQAEIGYWLARPYWGQGIMTDVVRAACQLAVTEWQLVRISAHVFDFNLASARVLEKNGFLYEGTLRKHCRKDGQFFDSRVYALVR